MTQTPLDAAHNRMEAAPGDETARLGFYALMIDTPLFLLLETEAQGETLAPRTFDLESGPVVLAFDSEERLAEFAGAAVPYAMLPGRVLAAMLEQKGLGLGLNLDVAPSATLLAPDAIEWLAELLHNAPREVSARASSIHAPVGVPEALLRALDARLARASGLAHCAWLAGVRYDGGGQGHLLVFVDAAPAARLALAQAVSEALTFSGLEAGALDVAHIEGGNALADRLARVALRFELPAPEIPGPATPSGPGMDRSRPPRLR